MREKRDLGALGKRKRGVVVLEQRRPLRLDLLREDLAVLDALVVRGEIARVVLRRIVTRSKVIGNQLKKYSAMPVPTNMTGNKTHRIFAGSATRLLAFFHAFFRALYPTGSTGFLCNIIFSPYVDIGIPRHLKANSGISA